MKIFLLISGVIVLILLLSFADPIYNIFLPSKYGIRPFKHEQGGEYFQIYYKNFWPFWHLVDKSKCYKFEEAMKKAQAFLEEDKRVISNRRKKIIRVTPESYN